MIQGDDALLPLAGAAQHPGGQIQVVHIQRDQLADPDAGGVQQLQHGPVPVALQVGALRLLQKQLHLFARQDLGQLSLHLGRDHPLGRVVVHDPQGDQAAVKGFDGCDGAGHCGGGAALPGQRGGVVLHLLGQHLCELQLLLLHSGLELVHIPQIGADGVGRRLFFCDQIVLIEVQQFRHADNSLTFFLVPIHSTNRAEADSSAGAARNSSTTHRNSPSPQRARRSQ